MLLNRIFNVLLRGGTLLCKFLLVISLAKYLTIEEYAIYGLIVATIGYAIYPLGFEFYTYSTRELVRAKNKERGRFLKSQLALHAIFYAIALPLFCFLFVFNLIHAEYIAFFYILVVLEHANQELFRLQVALSKQLQASCSLFLRHGAWVLVVVLLMWYEPSYRNLHTVLMAWSIGGVFSLLLSILIVTKMQMGGWSERVDWSWAKKGLLVAIPFFIATIGVNGITTVDKYLIGFVQGSEFLAVYILFLSLSVSLISFLDAGVFSFLYPSMISKAKESDFVGIISLMKKMLIQVVFFSFFFLLFAFVFLDIILGWVGKQSFKANVVVFYVLFLMVFVQALSYIPHYALYAIGKDKPIVYSGVASFFIFIGVSALYYSLGLELAIPFSMLTTFCAVLVWKTYSFKLEYGKLIHSER